MTGRRLLIPAMLALLAGPAFSAAAAKEEDTDKEKAEETGPKLPASMQAHGVIGHVDPMPGLPLMDASLLDQMRARLIELSKGPAK